MNNQVGGLDERWQKQNMKHWPLKTAIAAIAVTLTPMKVHALEGEPTVLNATPPNPTRINHQQAGLRINRSNIVTAFHQHLTEYFGDCPGQKWSGSAAKDNVRFVAYNQAPAKHLRVELINLTSGERLKKKYTKQGRGSSDFRVLSLGGEDGLQEIQYIIFNKKTDAILQTGNFSYDLKTSFSSQFREGEWRWEKFCASDYSNSLKDCDVIGQRERMYCQGTSTHNIRAEYIPHRRRHRPHPHPTLHWNRVSPKRW